VNLEDLCTRRVAVWGLGQEGTDLVGLLRGRGVEPLLVDDDPAGASSRVGTAAGGPPVIAPADVDWSTVVVVVRAPGVSRYRPELRAAEAAGTTVTTAMAVWLADFADTSVLAITGTKGKSTTAALAAAVLRAMGREVELVGNIGVPVTETYARPRAGAYVVEVSSYQATDVTTTPRVCVLTSLAPDHLDWHGGIEPYYRDKLHLLEAGPDGASGSVAVNAASGEAVRRTASHPDRLLYGPTGRVVADGDGTVSADGVVLVEAGTLGVPGRHNLWNVCGAISGVLLLEGRLPPAAAVAEAVAGFSGLPSRCQVVGQRHGRTLVDDALASNPFATQASVDVFSGRELAVIAGGVDRGVDMGGLAASLAGRHPVPTVVVVEPGGHRLAEALATAPGGADVPVVAAASLEDAVSAAIAATAPGGVILFSPAQPTPPGEGDFHSRSRRFLEAATLGRSTPVSGGRPGSSRGPD
jgi:UDP-N-acetylmuramoylalanine--D-glutamate ligase